MYFSLYAILCSKLTLALFFPCICFVLQVKAFTFFKPLKVVITHNVAPWKFIIITHCARDNSFMACNVNCVSSYSSLTSKSSLICVHSCEILNFLAYKI